MATPLSRSLRRLAFAPLFLAVACSDQDPIDPIDPAFAKGGPNASPTSTGRIFFSSFMTGNYDIFSINPDGSELRRLTFGGAPESSPVVSPDGRKVAYLYNRVGESLKWDLWIMNADGSKQQLRLVAPDDVYGFYSPTWSPDGRSIAFSYFTVQGNVEHVARVNVNNGGMVTLFPGGMPTWSPDGAYIAFSRMVPGEGPQLFTSRLDGSDLRQHTSFDYCCGEPQWSPDRREVLIWGRHASGVELGLYAVSVNGSMHWRKISSRSGQERHCRAPAAGQEGSVMKACATAYPARDVT
jgi:Tol biopolymer transport system component